MSESSGSSTWIVWVAGGLVIAVLAVVLIGGFFFAQRATVHVTPTPTTTIAPAGPVGVTADANDPNAAR